MVVNSRSRTARVPAKRTPVSPRSRRTETVESFFRESLQHARPVGSPFAARRLGDDQMSIQGAVSPRAISPPTSQQVRTRLPQSPQALPRPAGRHECSDGSGYTDALKQTHGGLRNELQYESEHHGEYDRACHVNGRQDGQNQQTTEKERLRIGRQRHLDIVGRLR